MGDIATNEALWQVLHTIDRSILPRTIDLRTRNGRIQIEASASKALLCPRAEGGYLTDDELRQEAPEAWEILRGGVKAVATGSAVLTAARAELLRLCARALLRLTDGASAVERGVKALRPIERWGDGQRLPSFTALELATALAPALLLAARGPVAAFYSQLAAKLPDAWLFDRAGRPAGYPKRVTRLGEIEEMANSVASARTWRAHLDREKGPVMAVFVEPSRESVRCLAIDDGYIALISGTGLELSAMLSAWRVVQQGAGTT